MAAGGIYSATYSNVPVYEFACDNNHVMRRRSDDYINATHILKVADFDKPARTRILEREVQRGTHEKVQGGYGKYQGTWIPMSDARALAEKNGVLERLLPIFDFVPGDRSPPPAPKHATASSAKTKQARASGAARGVNGGAARAQPNSKANGRRTTGASHQRNKQSDMSFDTFSARDEGTPEHVLPSDEESDFLQSSRHSMAGPGSRKRKRSDRVPALTYEEQQHLMWSDELLDYFMLQTSRETPSHPPEPPSFVDLDRPIDEKGHTAIHWAAAMGDVNVVKDLKRRGAHINVQSATMGETPLMRAVMFTNNFENQTMDEILELLLESVGNKDAQSGTVLHHICAQTASKSKYQPARYYLETILRKLHSLYDSHQIKPLLDVQDHAGDTAILIAARNGARKCVRLLLESEAAIDIPNAASETADELIKDLNARRRDRTRAGSSSPPPGPNGTAHAPHTRTSSFVNTTAPKPRYSSEAASLLAAQLPSLIASRAEALASALDVELDEREREVQEAEQLLEQRKAEIDSLARQSSVLAAKSADEAYDAAQLRELDALIAESRSLLLAEQAHDLAALLATEMARLPPSPSLSRPDTNPVTAEKVSLVQDLVVQQSKRPRLVEDIVQAQAVAVRGTDQRGEMYKRLIGAALGVDPEGVEGVLPEILADLEAEAGAGGIGERERERGVDGDGDVRMGASVRVS